MGSEQSRPEGFDFLDDRPHAPPPSNDSILGPRTSSGFGVAPASIARNNLSRQSAAAAAAVAATPSNRQTQQQNNDDNDDNDNWFPHSEIDHGENDTLGLATSAAAAAFSAMQRMATSSGGEAASPLTTRSANNSNNNNSAAIAPDPNEQDERRFLLLFELMHLCEQEFEKTTSSNNSPAPAFESAAVLWDTFAMLRACRRCGAYTPKFRHACLTGSNPALVLLCDECQANGQCEVVNATADSVAHAVLRMPGGFHGSVVTGTWQLPLVNLALEKRTVAATSTTQIVGNNNNGSNNGSASSTPALRGTTNPTAAASLTPVNNNSSSNFNLLPRASTPTRGGAGTGDNTPTNRNNNSSSNNNSVSSPIHRETAVPATIRFLFNTFLFCSGSGPVAVVQGVSGTTVETCSFGSVLPRLEFISLSTTCNQRDGDLEHAKRMFRERTPQQQAHLRFAIEGRSFDDKSLMLLTHVPFKRNIVQLNLTNCDRITSAGFRLIAKCFPNLKKLNLRGSSNIDLDVERENRNNNNNNAAAARNNDDDDEARAKNVLELLVDGEVQSSIATDTQQQQQQQPPLLQAASVITEGNNKSNPLCRSLESLDLSASALQLESRIGVLGRLRSLTELDLSGCECVHDEGFCDMMRVAAWSWANDAGVLPPVLVQPQHSPSPSHNSSNRAPSAASHVYYSVPPLRPAEAEVVAESYRSHLVVLRQSSNNSPLCTQNSVATIKRFRTRQRVVPTCAWLSSLNLSGVKFLTDQSLRWLCATWVSPDSYAHSLQESSGSVSLRNQAGGSATQQQQQPAVPSTAEVVSVFAQRVSLIRPRPLSDFAAGDGSGIVVNSMLSPRSSSSSSSSLAPTSVNSSAAASPSSVAPTPTNSAAAAVAAAPSMLTPQREIEVVPAHAQTSITYDRVARQLRGEGHPGENANSDHNQNSTKVNSISLVEFPSSWLAVSLRSISVADCTGFTSAGLQLLVTSFPAVTLLDLSGTHCNDTVIALLSHNVCPQLRELHLRRCPVSCVAVCDLLGRLQPSLEVFSVSPFVAAAATTRNNRNDAVAAAAAAAASVTPRAADTTHHDDPSANDDGEEEEQDEDATWAVAKKLRRALLLRDACAGGVRVLGLPDTSLALRFIKMLARSRQQPGALGSLRVLSIPAVGKLIHEETLEVLPTLARDGRMVPADSLARMASSAVQSFLREASHQLECDLLIQHQY